MTGCVYHSHYLSEKLPYGVPFEAMALLVLILLRLNMVHA